METIKYKDSEFRIKENSIAIKKAAIPLSIEYNLKSAKHLSRLDTSRVDFYKDKIGQYELVIKQLQELNPDDFYFEQQTNAQKIEEMQARISELDGQFMEDKEAQYIAAKRNEIEALITADIALKTDIMKEIFENILEGDLSKIDYNDDDYMLFALRVLKSFFTVARMSNSASGK